MESYSRSQSQKRLLTETQSEINSNEAVQPVRNSCSTLTSRQLALETSLNESLDKVAAYVSRFNDLSFESMCGQMSSADVAKLSIALSFTMTSLVYILGAIDGDERLKKSVMEELDRVKEHLTRLNKLDTESAKRPVLDTAAASRMVMFELLGKNSEPL